MRFSNGLFEVKFLGVAEFMLCIGSSGLENDPITGVIALLIIYSLSAAPELDMKGASVIR